MAKDDIDELLEMDGVNAPKTVPGTALSGSRPFVTPEEALMRRQNMSAALRDGASKDAIFATFTAKPFFMSEVAIIELMREVRAMWLEEDAENQEYERGAAIRRLKRHIGKAGDAGRWAAVAALEKVLADVNGTSVVVAPVNTDQRFQEGVLAVLGELAKDQTRLALEVAAQRRLVDASAVVVHGEEVQRVRRSG